MAGLIPRAFIDQLLLRADIVGIIGKYVPLKKRGREHIACCPFHNEKTPSFSVSSEKQIFYCFGCQEGGNVISFLMKHQRLEFHEAVEALAQECGVDVPREADTMPVVERERQKKAFGVMGNTAKYYYTLLRSGGSARDYLKERGVESATADAFALGYAPPNRGYLKHHFGEAYDEELLINAGLLNRVKDGHVYERLRDRLVFPIRDRRGRVIAFGGRILPGDNAPAKYINSPETLLFQKRNALYGIYELRNAGKYDRIIMVEGYMDVIALAQNGVRNVLATLGTASTRAHIQKVLRIVPHAVFCFDGDNAGRLAAVRALEQAMAVITDGDRIDFMFLPQGHDPDSFVREHGRRAFDEAVQKAVPLSDFLFEHHAHDLDMDKTETGAQLVGRIKPLLSQLPAGTFRELMFKRLADTVGIAVEKLQPDETPSGAPRTLTGARGRAVPRPHGRRLQYQRITTAIALLMHDPGLAQTVANPQELMQLDKPGAKLLAEILSLFKEHEPANSAGAIEMYRDTEHAATLVQLAAQPLTGEDEAAHQREFADAMQGLHRDLVGQEIDALKSEGDKSGWDAEKIRRLTELCKEERALGPGSA